METNKTTSNLHLFIAAPNTNQWSLRALLYDEILKASGRKPLTSGRSLSSLANQPYAILTLAPNELAKEFDICSTLSIPVVVHGRSSEAEVIGLICEHSSYESPAVDMVSLAAGEQFGEGSRVMLVLEVADQYLELLKLVENPGEPDCRRYFTAEGRAVDPEVTARLYVEAGSSN